LNWSAHDRRKKRISGPKTWKKTRDAGLGTGLLSGLKKGKAGERTVNDSPVVHKEKKMEAPAEKKKNKKRKKKKKGHLSIANAKRLERRFYHRRQNGDNG